MRITVPDSPGYVGMYVRAAELTDYDLIRLCTRAANWPGAGGEWSASMCRDLIQSSLDNFDPLVLLDNPIPTIGQFVLVLCLSDETPVGFMGLSYHSDAIQSQTGVDVTMVAVHPSHQGQGHYTRFERAVGWLCNQYLEAGAAHFEVLEDAPQVLAKANEKAPTKWAKKDDKNRDLTMVEHTQADYESAAFPTPVEKVGYSIIMTDALGVEVTVTARL